MTDPDSGAAAAQQMAQEAEFGSRRLEGFTGTLIGLLAAGWSLFQLSLPYFVMLTSDIVRAVHLAFAMALVFLSYPALKKKKLTGVFSFLSRHERTPLADIVLAVVGAGAAAYYAYDIVGLGQRQGLPLPRDYVLGILLLVLLLEAARRALGPALPAIAALFIGVSFLGPELPDFMAFKRVTPQSLISQLTMTTEGVYGVPLGVSASTVFLFVLFGAMLEKSGGGQYFVQLAFSLMGRFKGGPAKAAVLASGLTGLVSGSSIANTVTTGTFTIPLMKKAGYPPEKAAAIEVAASTNGQLMPPIMGAAAFIIAERCGLPYFEVVRAAFIPAVISYLALIYITHLEAGKLGLKGVPREELPRFWKVFRGGAHFLIPLAFLIYLLIIQRLSPELSAFWAIVALAALVLLRNLWQGRRDGRPLAEALESSRRFVWESLVAGGRSMMGIGVAVAAAGIIVGIMTLGPGGLVTNVIARIAGDSIFLLLIVTAVVSLVLGMGLPTTANYIVMATLTVPVILNLAGQTGLVVPAIAAHLFCFYFGILADDTPPVGLAAYAAAAIAKSDPIRTGIQGFTYDMRTAILPFMFLFNTDLLLIGVSSWWHIALIFVMGVIAMFAFAALTQNYFLTRNRVHESVLLGLSSLLLLRPEFSAFQQAYSWCALRLDGFIPFVPGSLIWHPGAHKFAAYAAGASMFLAAFALQHIRIRRKKSGC